jgi:hypothetical protein
MFELPEVADCRAQFSKDGYVLVGQSLSARAAFDLAAVSARAVDSFARSIDRRGRGSRLAYRVVTGDWIECEAPVLFDLYTSAALLKWIREVTSCATVSRSPHIRSAININCLTAPREEYPQHCDAVPYTVLLFLSDVEPEADGHFVIHSLAGEVARIQPRLGQRVLMDGARCRHGVAPLAREAWRVTLPMVFLAQVAERPEGLDDYLYGSEAASAGDWRDSRSSDDPRVKNRGIRRAIDADSPSSSGLAV